MMTSEDFFYVSSQLVREIASFHGDVTGLVPRTSACAWSSTSRRSDVK